MEGLANIFVYFNAMFGTRAHTQHRTHGLQYSNPPLTPSPTVHKGCEGGGGGEKVHLKTHGSTSGDHKGKTN